VGEREREREGGREGGRERERERGGAMEARDMCACKCREHPVHAMCFVEWA